MIYLYAITDHPLAGDDPGQGLENRPVFWLSFGSVSAFVSTLASAAPPSEANLWRHESVVEALMAGCTVLPVRFGTLFADKEALGVAVAACDQDLVRDLERVRGRVELGLRVLWDEADSLQPPRNRPAGDARASLSGRDYMLTRLEEERQARNQRQRAETLATQIHHPLAQLAVESRRQLLLTPRLLLTSAYLVERGQVSAFEQQLDALRTAWPQLCLLCTGPWPAYSFVNTNITTAP